MLAWSVAPRETSDHPHQVKRQPYERVAAAALETEPAGSGEAVGGDNQKAEKSLGAFIRRAFTLPTSMTLAPRLIAFYSISMSFSVAALVWLVAQLWSAKPVLSPSEVLLGVGGMAMICLELLLGSLADMRDISHK
jgi:hypothetical protein